MKFLLIFALSIISCRAQMVVKLNFYSSLSDFKSISGSNVADFSSLSTNYYDPLKKNEIYIHGWLESPSDESSLTVASAYLTRKSEFNVILVDWSSVTQNYNLIDVVLKVDTAADIARDILNQLQLRGLIIGNTHLVGFSLGVLVAGRIGRWFKTQRAMPFPRITALDPPNVANTFDLFFLFGQIERITKNDANFVDVVHTNADGIGDRATSGHVNFWPNGGSVQPGCNFVSMAELRSFIENPGINATLNAVGCSHLRAPRFYAESVKFSPSSPGFLSKQCPRSVFVYNAFTCTIFSTASMGYYAEVTIPNFSSTLAVNYYLQTNAQSPFSKN